MADVAVASIEINSDWGTLQLTSDDATLKAIDGFKYPRGIIFTSKGMILGQPNKGLQPQKVKLSVQILTDAETVNFITGHGDSAAPGSKSGCIIVILAGNEYRNADITYDGLSIKAFNNCPVLSTE